MFGPKRTQRHPQVGRMNLSILLIFCFVVFSSATVEQEFEEQFSYVVKSLRESIKKRRQLQRKQIHKDASHEKELEGWGVFENLEQFGFSERFVSTSNH